MRVHYAIPDSLKPAAAAALISAPASAMSAAKPAPAAAPTSRAATRRRRHSWSLPSDGGVELLFAASALPVPAAASSAHRGGGGGADGRSFDAVWLAPGAAETRSAVQFRLGDAGLSVRFQDDTAGGAVVLSLAWPGITAHTVPAKGDTLCVLAPSRPPLFFSSRHAPLIVHAIGQYAERHCSAPGHLTLADGTVDAAQAQIAELRVLLAAHGNEMLAEKRRREDAEKLLAEVWCTPSGLPFCVCHPLPSPSPSPSPMHALLLAPSVCISHGRYPRCVLSSTASAARSR